MDGKLHLSLLGRIDVRRDDVLLADFRSRKAQALLFYLATTGTSHSRSALAGLLWADMPEADARMNLRQALTKLRKIVGRHLTITRRSLAFKRDNAYWLDVEAFEAMVMGATDAADEADIERLCDAVDLYQGDFLAGFYVPRAPLFEEWTLAQQARLRALALDGLRRLTDWYTERNDYANGITYTRRLLELEPWDESAHRGLMLLLAYSGQRGAALAQYETCRRVLEEELGVPPGEETTAFYEQLLAGQLESPLRLRIPPYAPAFLDPEREPIATTGPVFVARERELAWLGAHLDAALAGHGRAAFVTGGPGRGKTMLLREFARQALRAHPELLFALGNCNAYAGVGDPYLPFRDVLGMLTGDVESRWVAGAITRQHARRLWDALPDACQAVLDYGASLIDIFLPAAPLLSRVAAAFPDDHERHRRWQALIERQHAETGGLEQSHLFEQVTNVLRTLATWNPLLLLLDDLQWADSASIGLLFHLGRRLLVPGNRVLIVCAYRPEEVALGRASAGSGRWERHPLEKTLAEFKRRFGDVQLDLAQVKERQGQEFVAALLDTEPNRLDATFRDALFRRTAGHPLFTVELLRAMQQQGDLVQDPVGNWIEGPTLHWERLPARVEAVVGERLGRLEGRLRDILTVASVEGDTFTAQVVAQVQGIPEQEFLQTLSQELRARHRLVQEAGEVHIAGTGWYLSRYQFTHSLFREYLHSALSAGERRLLHGKIALALETLYDDQAVEIVAQLAHHYAEAGQLVRAIEYALRASEHARRAYANEEAIKFLQRGLALLGASSLDDSRAAWYHEIAAQLNGNLGDVLELTGQHGRARKAYEAAISYGTTKDRVWVSRLHRLLGDTYKSQGRYEEALRIYARAENALESEPTTSDNHLWREWIEIQFSRMLLYYGKGDADQMLALAERVQPSVDQYGTLAQRAELCRLNGQMSARRERYRISSETLTFCQQALALCQEMGTVSKIAYAHFFIGFCHLWHSDVQEAEKELKTALAVARRVGWQETEILCFTYLSLLYRITERLGKCHDYITRTLSLISTTDMPTYAGMADANLAWLAWRSGDLASVLEHGHAALAFWEGSVYPFQWAALWPLIDIALTQDRLPDAVDFARALLAPSQQQLPDPLTTTLEGAIQAWECGQPDSAREVLNQALSTAQKLAYL
jgi:DNA-binding SARP family transcriptional activator/predicted ATPase